MDIATGQEAAFADARLFRIEWPIRDGEGHDAWCDFVIEGPDRKILEVVECREHLTAIPIDSVEEFLQRVTRLRAGSAVTSDTRFRFVSPSPFLSDGRNLEEEDSRAIVFRTLGEAVSEAALAVVWDFRRTKTALTNAACTAMMDSIANAKEMCRSLYARLAAQLSDRWPNGSEACRDGFRDVLVDLFPGDPQRHTRELNVPPEDAFDVLDLKRRLNAVAPLTRLAADVRQALTARLYPDDDVTTSDVLIELNGRYEWVEGASREKVQRSISVTDALFDWLTDIHDTRALAEPLVVVGPFGAGKTTALKAFAARLLDSARRPAVPIFIQLRDLARTTDPQKIDRRIEQYVAAKGFDITNGSPSGLVCLICDGFDELNLYYDVTAGWAKSVYQQLRDLAARQNIAVIVSSRPLQLLDQVAEVSKRGDTTRRISIEELTPEQVEEWCRRYRQQANLPAEFSWHFLEERKLSTIARTPIILYMIARLYATAPELLPARAYTLGEIYQRFVDWTIDGAYAAEKKKHRVPSNYRHVLQEIAWHLAQAKGGMLAKSRLLQLLRETFGDVIEDVPVDVNLLVAHMLQPAGESGDEPDSLIEFTHQSFRDYLVAERLVRLASSDGAALTADILHSVTGNAVTPATLGFLFDALDKMPNDERRRLLIRTVDADDVEKIVTTLMPVTPGRAATLAGLMMLLRIRAASGLRDEEQQAGLKDIEHGISADPFQRLLHVLRAFPNDSDAEATLTLFTRHLDGLSFRDDARLEGLTLDLPRLHRAALRSVSAPRADLYCRGLVNCAFVDVDLQRSSFHVLSAQDVAFRDCNFASARLSIGGPDDRARVQIVGSTLNRAEILFLYAENSSFVRNSWTEARLGRSVLVDCRMDAEALAFFRRSRVAMANCRLERTADKWRTTDVWKSLRRRLAAADADTFFAAAEELLGLAVSECRTPSRVRIDSDVLRLYCPNTTAEVFWNSERRDRRDALTTADRYVVVVNEDGLQLARSTIVELAETGRLREGTAWTPADLVDEAFYATFEHVRPAFRRAVSTESIPQDVFYRRSDLRLLKTEEGIEVHHHTRQADVHGDPLDELERTQRARITFITFADAGRSRALIDRLIENSGDRWMILDGANLPHSETDVASLLLRFADEYSAKDETERSITRALLESMALDPAGGCIIENCDEAPYIPNILRLFRDATSSLILTMANEAYAATRDLLYAELATWPSEPGLAQTLLVLEVA